VASQPDSFFFFSSSCLRSLRIVSTIVKNANPKKAINVAITNTSPPASFQPSYNPIASPIGVVINNSGLPIFTV